MLVDNEKLKPKVDSDSEPATIGDEDTEGISEEATEESDWALFFVKLYFFVYSAPNIDTWQRDYLELRCQSREGRHGSRSGAKR